MSNGQLNAHCFLIAATQYLCCTLTRHQLIRALLILLRHAPRLPLDTRRFLPTEQAGLIPQRPPFCRYIVTTPHHIQNRSIALAIPRLHFLDCIHSAVCTDIHTLPSALIHHAPRTTHLHSCHGLRAARCCCSGYTLPSPFIQLNPLMYSCPFTP